MNKRTGMVFLALTAPLAALSGQAAGYGRMGWLGAVAALPGVLILSWCLRRNGDYGERLGEVGGKWLKGLYYIWLLLTAALTASSAVDALGRTDYQNWSNWALAGVLSGATFYLAGKGTQAVLRWGQVMGAGYTIIIVCFLALGLRNADWSGLIPKEAAELGAAAGAALPVLGAACLSVIVGFLPGGTEKPGRGWAVGWCAVATGLCAVTFGTLGAELTAQAPLPFFLALQGLGEGGTFQRLEAVGTAAWSLSYLALILLCGVAMERLCGGKRWNRWVLAGAVICGGGLSNEAVRPFSVVLLAGNVIFGGVIPAMIALGRWEKDPEKTENTGGRKNFKKREKRA